MSFVTSIAPITGLVLERPDAAAKALAKVVAGSALASTSVQAGGLLTMRGLGGLGIPLAASGSRSGAGLVTDGIRSALAGALGIRFT